MLWNLLNFHEHISKASRSTMGAASHERRCLGLDPWWLWLRWSPNWHLGSEPRRSFGSENDFHLYRIYIYNTHTHIYIWYDYIWLYMIMYVYSCSYYMCMYMYWLVFCCFLSSRIQGKVLSWLLQFGRIEAETRLALGQIVTQKLVFFRGTRIACLTLPSFKVRNHRDWPNKLESTKKEPNLAMEDACLDQDNHLYFHCQGQGLVLYGFCINVLILYES